LYRAATGCVSTSAGSWSLRTDERPGKQPDGWRRCISLLLERPDDAHQTSYTISDLINVFSAAGL
jgi:hypothetical protein